MSIVKYKNQSGVMYAYEATSQYDPITKQSRPIRKYLGRVDPETGEIVPTTGKRGRPPKSGSESSSVDHSVLPPEQSELIRRLSETETEISELRAKNQELVIENHRLKEFLSKLIKESSDFVSGING